MTKPNEPTLTCSEVVERLQRLLVVTDTRRAADLAKFREKSAAILHSWRERRVQELEEALLALYEPSKAIEIAVTWELTPEIKEAIRSGNKLAENALKSDEWREQIRKGEV